jgi:hypothetical protein
MRIVDVVLFLSLCGSVSCAGQEKVTKILNTFADIHERVQPMADNVFSLCSKGHDQLSALGQPTKELDEACAEFKSFIVDYKKATDQILTEE